MKIGIIGTGNFGGTAAHLFVDAGHSVMLSNSRGPQSLQAFVKELGPNAIAGSINDAARFGKVIFLAVPWRKADRPVALPNPAIVVGKIVIDAMNPYTQDDGYITDFGAHTSSELLQKLIPGAKIVKSFNTIGYRHLARSGDTSLPLRDRQVIFLAGDDAAAKGVVRSLIESIGFAAFDTGDLRDGSRCQQPGTPVYDIPMTMDQARKLVSPLLKKFTSDS